MNCDALLMIGTDFPYQQFFPKDATIIQIDLRGEQIGRRSKVDFGLLANTEHAAELYCRSWSKSGTRAFGGGTGTLSQVTQGLDELAIGDSGNKPIHPQYVARVIDELASG